MRKWFWMAPVILMAGCSKSEPPQAVFANPGANAPVAATTPAAYPVPASSALDPAPEPASVSNAVIPSGTLLRVRMEETVSTKTNNAGDRFEATLVGPVSVGGESVLPAGTRVRGHIMSSDDSGRMKGRARIVLTLDSVERNGRSYNIHTTAASQVSQSHKKRNIIGIAGGSGIGAAIGAIAGGGKGAAIGAGAGAAAGTAGVAATGVLHVTIPAETVLSFRLGAAVRI